MKVATDFKHIKVDGYTNINELVKVTDRLHTSETLFGDRNARILLLAQDGANEDRMRETIEYEEKLGRDPSSGYRHGENVATNRNLVLCFSDFLKSYAGVDKNWTARDCGLFYANVVWLLKQSKGMGGSLPRLREVLDACRPVFYATLEGLPKLELVIALGKTSYSFLSHEDPTLQADWRRVANGATVQPAIFGSRKLKVATIPHPSPRSGGRDLQSLRNSVDAILSNLRPR